MEQLQVQEAWLQEVSLSLTWRGSTCTIVVEAGGGRAACSSAAGGATRLGLFLLTIFFVLTLFRCFFGCFFLWFFCIFPKGSGGAFSKSPKNQAVLRGCSAGQALGHEGKNAIFSGEVGKAEGRESRDLKPSA